MFRVKCRKTGKIITIREDEFDEELHERIEGEGDGDGTSLADMDAAEFVEGIGRAVEGAMESFAERLGAGQVDRSRVAVRPAGERGGDADGGGGGGSEGQPYGTAARLMSPERHRYRELPEAIREIRTPDTDHWCAEWFRGRWDNDFARMRQAHDEIAKLRGWERDLNTADDSALIPQPMAATVMELRRQIQLWGPRAMSMPVPNGTLRVPRETAFAPVQRPGEGVTGVPSDPTFSEFTLTLKKAMVYSVASFEMLSWSPFNLIAMLSQGASRSLALDADQQDLVTGDGAGENQTDAVLNNGSIGETAAIGTLTYADINTIYRAVPAVYRSNGVWVGSNVTLGYLDGLLDLNGRPIFDDSNQAVGALEGGQGGMPSGTIKRRPVLEIPIPDGTLIFGDPQAFGVGEGGGIRAEVSRDARFFQDQTAWKWVQMRDGAVGQPVAFHKGTGITGS